ncbi:DUF2252 domain-containing protein [Agromyces sp. NPDC056965]|uniref:DUF2252 domain-containing protein n=1 Tax=Agromyces sp. NPDC056965 TaxID=3345983 RepID=UPI00363D1A4A
MTPYHGASDAAESGAAAPAEPLPDPTDFAARAEWGRAARRRSPRADHAGWAPAADRPDPVALLEEQAANRVAELIPIRHARMMASPFSFYRGAAVIMAADLAATADSGITVQICGDAHLLNFGVFGTPERTLGFDINDFDETLPGPWEWDLKRLAASFEIACRHRGFEATERHAITVAAVRGYRERMKRAAASRVLEAWYDRLDADAIAAWVRSERRAGHADKQQVERTESSFAKARTRDSMRAFSKLVRLVDGELRITADPPLIVPIDDLRPLGRTREEDEQAMRHLLHTYQTTLPVARHPLREFTYVHMARKVVGVGSVGTRAWIVLLQGRDRDDPLLLQAKEAQESVLARYLAPSEYAEHGERVVRGQRMMQAASDIFLGWQRVPGHDGVERDFYLRQLHDWKGALDVGEMVPVGARLYAQVCGETLARAHARSGDRVAIAGYLGESDRFDEAVADFAVAYADQNERDYRAFVAAVESGRLLAEPEG